MAVNFSPLQFEPGLPTRIAGVLHRYGILPKRLIIEITEAVIMKDDRSPKSTVPRIFPSATATVTR